jgi:Cu+-exporting ATPase
MTVSSQTLGLTTAVPVARAECLHCGDPCDDGGVVNEAGAFCCTGCASVYALLTAHGLTGFYACAPDAGRSLKDMGARPPDRFAVLDDPEVAGRLVDGHDGTFTYVTFNVPSLHCASCLWLLEQLWRFDEGIGRSEADLLRRTVRVAFRPDRITLRAVAERLASLGYEPVIDAERGAGRMPAHRRTLLLKLGVAGFAFGNMMLFSIPRYANGAPLEPAFQRLFDTLNILFALPVLVFSASDFFTSAWRALRLRAITLDVPVALGLTVLFVRSLADILTGAGEGYLDSFAGLVFFLLIGRLAQQMTFDRIAFDRTVRSFLPLSVRVRDASGLTTRRIEELVPGDVLFVRPGEIVPADAMLIDEAGRLDYAFVTGEAAPEDVSAGDVISAGGRVADHAMHLKVLRPASQSRLADLWQHPVFARRREHWLTTVAARFGHWFTISALALAAIGAIAWWPDARMAAHVATAVLIIACPCAMTLAAPITLGTGLARLGLAGCYLKDGAVALDLSRVDTIAFDKTGTLTTAGTEAGVDRRGLTDDEWALVHRLAAESIHPISRTLVPREPLRGRVEDVHVAPGQGIRGRVDGHDVVIGSAAYVSAEAGAAIDGVAGRTYAAVDGRPGALQLATTVRPGMQAAVTELARTFDTWLLSGDAGTEAPIWRPVFGDRMHFRLAPDEKLALVRERREAGGHVLMIGDGLNDAGALAAADVGMAVSDDTACLVPACDAVVRGDQLPRLPEFLRYARRARQVIVLCFAVSMVYNVIGIGLALAGRLTPLAAAILMPVSSLTVVGLSVGLMRLRAPREVRP